MRTFQFSDARSHKFWQIEVSGKSFTVTYGKVGTAGQTQTKTFPTPQKARDEADKLIKEKLKKGYTETTPKATASTGEALEAVSQNAALTSGRDELDLLPDEEPARVEVEGDRASVEARLVDVAVVARELEVERVRVVRRAGYGTDDGDRQCSGGEHGDKRSAHGWTP